MMTTSPNHQPSLPSFPADSGTAAKSNPDPLPLNQGSGYEKEEKENLEDRDEKEDDDDEIVEEEKELNLDLDLEKGEGRVEGHAENGFDQGDNRQGISPRQAQNWDRKREPEEDQENVEKLHDDIKNQDGDENEDDEEEDETDPDHPQQILQRQTSHGEPPSVVALSVSRGGGINNTNNKDDDIVIDNEDQDPEKQQSQSRKPTVLQSQTNLLPRRSLLIVFSGLSLSLSLSMLDQTIISTSLPSISSSLNSGKSSSWVATSYLLTSTAFQPLWGRLSDVWGRKRVMVGCMGMFWIWSLACGVVRNMEELIVFRAFQGVGGGGIISLSMIIVSDVVSLKDRGKYQGIIASVIAVANGIGPLIGGAIAQNTTWRWCFFINLPLGAIAIFVMIFCLPLKHVKGDVKKKLLQVDYLGSALTLGGSVLLLLPLNWGGVTFPWTSAKVLGTIIASAVVFTLFGIWEWKGAKIPIIPLKIFKNKTVVGVYIGSVFNGMVFYVSLFFIPQLYQVVRGWSPTLSGVLLLPLMSIQALTSSVAGIVVSKTGKYKNQIMFGFAVWTVGMGLVSTLDSHSSVGAAVGYLLLSGVGAGQTFQTSLVAAQAAVPRKEMAVVTALRNWWRMLGGTIGLAIASTVLNNELRRKLIQGGLSESVIERILTDPTAIQKNDNDDGTGGSGGLSDHDKQVAIQGYRDGFKIVFYLAAAYTGVALLSTLFFVKEHPLTRKEDEELKRKSKQWVEERNKRKAAHHHRDSSKHSHNDGHHDHGEEKTSCSITSPRDGEKKGVGLETGTDCNGSMKSQSIEGKEHGNENGNERTMSRTTTTTMNRSSLDKDDPHDGNTRKNHGETETKDELGEGGKEL